MSTTIRNNDLFCLNCGGSFKLPLPMSTGLYAKRTKAFGKLHEDCEKTWVDPKADPRENTSARMIWWLGNGEQGMSSMTMFNCLSRAGNDFRVDHPYDSDDFSRCYKLLEAIPEWKEELDTLKGLSPEWKALVENWDELTTMYEAKEYKEMYVLMNMNKV